MALQFTHNSLLDILKFLREGHIVCLHDETATRIYYHRTEILDKITAEKIIYIDLSTMASLMDQDEWPWYIHNMGFVEYKSTHVLPTDETAIHYCKL
jgi:hypothetical protein